MLVLSNLFTSNRYGIHWLYSIQCIPSKKQKKRERLKKRKKHWNIIYRRGLCCSCSFGRFYFILNRVNGRIVAVICVAFWYPTDIDAVQLTPCRLCISQWSTRLFLILCLFDCWNSINSMYISYRHFRLSFSWTELNWKSELNSGKKPTKTTKQNAMRWEHLQLATEYFIFIYVYVHFMQWVWLLSFDGNRQYSFNKQHAI